MAWRNPYTPFAPAEENYVGREEILRLFSVRLALSSFDEGDSRHLLLEGRGGIGKTSLLKRLLLECKRDLGEGPCQAVLLDVGQFFGGPVDFVALVQSEIPGLREASKVPSHWVDQVRQSLKQVLRSVSVGFPAGISFQPFEWSNASRYRESGIAEIAASIEGMLHLAKSKKRRLVLLIDRFGHAAEMPGGLVFAWQISELMRRSFENGLANLLVVLAVRPERRYYLETRFTAEIMGEDFVRRVVIPPLTFEEAVTAILDPARREGVSLSDELATALVEQAGSHPYFLQLAAYRVWEYLREKDLFGRDEVTSAMIPLIDIVRDCEAKIFADFTQEEKYLLRVMARSPTLGLTRMQLKEAIERDGRTTQVNADQVLQALIQHRHRPITYNPSQDIYSFAHEHFRQYIRDNQLTSEELEIAALQMLLDSVIAVDLELDSAHLHRMWKYHESLRLEEDHIRALVLSNLRAFPWERQWIDWLQKSDSSHLTRILLEALRRPDPSLVSGATRALGNLRSTEAVEPLIQLMDHQSGYVRYTAALALGEIGDPRAIGPVSKMLNEKRWQERLSAIHALSQIDHADVVSPLTAALNDRSLRVRSAAAEALGKTRRDEAIPALSRALHDSSKRVALAAAKALAGMDDPQAIEALTDAVLRSRVPLRPLLSLLRDRGVEPTVDDLAPGLNVIGRVNRRAIEGLYMLGGDKAVDLLIQCIDHENRLLAWRARSCLALMDHPRARQAVPNRRKELLDLYIRGDIQSMNDKEAAQKPSDNE